MKLTASICVLNNKTLQCSLLDAVCVGGGGDDDEGGGGDGGDGGGGCDEDGRQSVVSSGERMKIT